GANQGQNMLVDVQDDNSLHVTDAESGRVFQIRELSEHEASTAVVKKRVTLPPQSAEQPQQQPAGAPGFSPAAATIIESMDALPEHIRRELQEHDKTTAGRKKKDEEEDEEDTDPGLRGRPGASAKTVLEMPKL